MKIWKELSFSPCCIGMAELETGVTLYVRTDGTADGSDGKRYAHVSCDLGDTLQELGWTSDADQPVILERESLRLL